MAKAELNIDINNIFYELHKIALEEAQKVSNDIDLQNYGVDEENENFLYAGEFAIIARAKDAQADIPDKSKFIEAIKKYVEFFIGKDQADKLKDDDFKPIDVVVAKTESMHYDARKPLLENLFMTEDDAEQEYQTVGYMLFYDVEIEGSKKKNFDGLLRYRLKKGGKNLLIGIARVGDILVKALWPGIKLIAKTAFGNVLKDIASLKVHTGSGDIDVGGKIKDVAVAAKDTVVGTTKAAAKAVWDATKMLYNNTKKVIFGPKDIEQIKSDFSAVLSKRFTDNRLQIELITVNALITELKQQKLFNLELEQKLNGLEYCIGVIAYSFDKNYSQYNTKSIAEEFTKAFGKYKNVFFKGTLTKENIIKIHNYKTDIKNKTDKNFNTKTTDFNDSLQTKMSILNLLFEENLLVEASSDPLEKLAALVAKLSSDDEAAAVFKIFANNDEDDVSDSALAGDFSSRIDNIKGRSGSKYKLVYVFRLARKEHPGKITEIKDFIDANYTPKNLSTDEAYERIYNAMNKAYNRVTKEKQQKSSSDLYLIDRNIKYNKDPHQSEEVKKGIK